LPFWLPVKPFVQFCKKSTEIHGEGDSPATKTQEILIKQKSFVATELNSMSEEESCVEPHFHQALAERLGGETGLGPPLPKSCARTFLFIYVVTPSTVLRFLVANQAQ
jgi:hypothetical protein